MLPFSETLFSRNLLHSPKRGHSYIGLTSPCLQLLTERLSGTSERERAPGAHVERGGRILLGGVLQKASK